jgi:hypothetical protein
LHVNIFTAFVVFACSFLLLSLFVLTRQFLLNSKLFDQLEDQRHIVVAASLVFFLPLLAAKLLLLNLGVEHGCLCFNLVRLFFFAELLLRF